jgi:hypothetical protein
MNIVEALDDPNLLGASIRDPDSWRPWRALLASAFGLPLDPYQVELFRHCTGRRAREQFSKRNIEYIPSERVKSDIYRDVLPLLNSRRVQLLDDRRIISQFHGLERRTARGGKDSIDHGPGHHDDVANAVAGAIVLASHHVRPLNFHPPTLGPPRSELIAAAGFGGPGGGLPISMADGMGVSSDKPGGW